MAFLAGKSAATTPRRVVVTGAGIITSMGRGWRENADGFREGRLAFREITLFDTSRQRVRTGGELKLPETLPDCELSAKARRRLDRASAMLVHAGAEAWQQCGWKPGEGTPLCLGTSAGAMAVGEEYYRNALTGNACKRGQSTRVATYLTESQAKNLQAALGIDGPATVITNACASGANAIGQAFRLVQSGRVERAVAGGYDALAQLVFAGFDALQALSTTIPRPFDADRDGLALGEGAAVVAIETCDAAMARGAEVLAEIAGYGTSTDVHHLTQPHPEGEAALASMSAACREAGLAPADVGYVNSHGTGTPLNDVAEGRAIRRWAGSDVAKVAVSSTKGSVGHLLGGAGAVEAVIAIMAMKEGWLPPTASVRTPDEVCTFDLVTAPRDQAVDAVLTNSFGFGGANATLAMRRMA